MGSEEREREWRMGRGGKGVREGRGVQNGKERKEMKDGKGRKWGELKVSLQD